MSALNDIADLVDTMRSRKGEMTTFEGLLREISVCMTEMLDVLEKPEEKMDHKPMIDAVHGIAAAIKGMKPPEVQVNVAAPPPAEVTVNVPQALPPQVVIMPAEKSLGWKLLVTSRDGNGNIREMSFKPGAA